MSRKINLNSTSAILTLDYYLSGTCSPDNEVKIIIAKKADMEGRSTDTIFYARFRTTMGVRLRRRGESYSINVERLLDTLTEDNANERYDYHH